MTHTHPTPASTGPASHRSPVAPGEALTRTPVPAIDPSQRPPDEIADAASFQQDDPVWAWSLYDGQWRPGIVNARSEIAVLVTYWRPGGGTGVDTLLPRHVMVRAGHDEDFHAAANGSGLPSRIGDLHSRHPRRR
jgi:hypothetical protein